MNETVEQEKKIKTERKIIEQKRKSIENMALKSKESTMEENWKEPNVVTDKIDGEFIVDAVGLLITGVRIILMNAEGDEEKVYLK